MSFEQHFEGPVVLAKQLEIRWFTSPSNPPAEENGKRNGKKTSRNGLSTPNRHRMPFLRRSLSYMRDERSPQRKKTGRMQNGKYHTIKTNVDLLDNFPPKNNRIGLSSTANRQKRTTCKFRNDKHDDDDDEEVYESVIAIDSDDGDDGPRNGHHRTKKRRYGFDTGCSDASAFGKPFPHYDPCSHGPPREWKPAFHYFCKSSREEARKALSRKNRRDKSLVKEQLEILWSDLSPTDILYWTQEETWDKHRFERERRIYISATFQRRQRPVRQRKKSRKTTARVSSKVFFHYHYTDGDNFPVIQVEARRDRRCPLCFQNACTDLGLALHCDTTHAGLSFEAAKDEEGNLHVSVRSDPHSLNYSLSSTNDHLLDFAFVKSIHHPPPKPVPFIKRPHQVAALDPATRKKKIRSLQLAGASTDDEALLRYVPGDQVPIRQYYHSRTNLPMANGEWNYDSDEEKDDEWLFRTSEELIDEFEDVSTKEKLFLKLWNRFKSCHTVTSDRLLPILCLEFVKTHGPTLAEADLRENLLLHLLNLWDSSLMSSKHISACMDAFDAIRDHMEKKRGFGSSAHEKQRCLKKRKHSNDVMCPRSVIHKTFGVFSAKVPKRPVAVSHDLI